MPTKEAEQKAARKKAAKKKSKKDKEPEVEALPLVNIEQQTGPSELWAIGAEKGYEHIMKVAEVFAHSGLVPERYAGKVNNCAIVIAMALKHKADILGFMQNIYMVHNAPGMESKLAIALANMSGVWTAPIQYDMFGTRGQSDRGCTAWAVDSRSGAKCEVSITIQDAEREGWTKPKKGMPSKWVTMPEMMLRYRGAMQLMRLYHPEVLFGMRTVDELEDVGPKTIKVEVEHPEADAIRKSITGAPPAQLPTPEEKPLSEAISQNSTPVSGAQQGVAAPVRTSNDPDQASLMGEDPDADPFATPPSQVASNAHAILDNESPADEQGRKDERMTIVALYSDLVSAAGESELPITKTSTKKLKEECKRLLAKN